VVRAELEELDQAERGRVRVPDRHLAVALPAHERLRAVVVGQAEHGRGDEVLGPDLVLHEVHDLARACTRARRRGWGGGAGSGEQRAGGRAHAPSSLRVMRAFSSEMRMSPSMLADTMVRLPRRRPPPLRPFLLLPSAPAGSEWSR